MTKFIAISGKGGVGKTTVAVNLASALHNSGKNVLLLEANTVSPHMSLHLGFPDVGISLHEVLEGKEKIDKAIYLHPSGLKVVPSNVSRHPTYKKAKSIASILLDLVGKASIVLMDLPPSLSEDAVSVIRSADETMVVTNNEKGAINDAIKSTKLAEDSGSFVTGVILNKATGKSAFDESLRNRIIGTIPRDKNVTKSLNIGHPVVFSHPFSAASIEFKKIANLLI